MSDSENIAVLPPVEEYTPRDISDPEKNIKFKIPLYQRLFAWNREKILVLLEDLYEHFQSDSGPYYLGVITQIQEKDYRVVLDGQQRLTVLMLLAAFFAKEDADWRKFLLLGGGNERNGANVAAIQGELAGCKAAQRRLFLFARPDDEACLDQLIADPEKALEEKKNMLMVNGYAAIREFFSKKKRFSADLQKKEFSKNIYNNLTLLATNLSSAYLKRPDYLNRYFEIMNSNYKNLEQHEVLKVRLVKGAANREKLLFIWQICENFSENIIEILRKKYRGKYQDGQPPKMSGISSVNIYARNMVKEFKKIMRVSKNPTGATRGAASGTNPDTQALKIDKIGDIRAAPTISTPVAARESRSIVTFPQFLLLALDIFLERKNGKPLAEEKRRAFYNPGNLLDTFKDKENGTERILLDAREEFYDCLLKLRALLDLYVIRRDGGHEDIYSVLLGKLNDEDEKRDTQWGPDEPTCCLAQYQAMLDAAFPEYFYTWLKPYLKHLYEIHFGNARTRGCSLTGPDATADMLLEWLKDLDNKRALKDKSAEVALSPEDALKPDKLTYDAHVDRYWFWRLDYYLWEGLKGEDSKVSTRELLGTDARTQKAARAYRMRTNRSIEHLYPQTPPDGRPPWGKEDLHAFGNLAMISSSFNSQQSNALVGVKFERVKDHISWSALQSLKLLAMYHAAGGEGGRWTKTTAEVHERRMREILRESFQRKSQGKTSGAEADIPGTEEES